MPHQPPLPAPPLCQHTCIDVPKAAATAAHGDGRDNAANIVGCHPPAVGNNDAVASIATTIPRIGEAPPPSSFVNARPLGGFTSTRRRTRRRFTTVLLSPQTWHDFKLHWVQPLVAAGGAVEEYDNQKELGVRGGIATSRCRQGPVLGQRQPPASSVLVEEHPLL